MHYLVLLSSHPLSQTNPFILASVASALLSSRLNQMNSISYGTALKHTASLQGVESALARVVVNECFRPPFFLNALLQQLRWFPLDWRYKRIHADLLQHHQPTKSLRSSSSHQLFIPRHHLSFGSRAFCFSAPRI